MLIGELFKNNWPERLVGVSFASLVFLLGHLQIQYADKSWHARNQDKLRLLAISQVQAIEQSVLRSISGVSVLADYIEQQHGGMNGVENIALALNRSFGAGYRLEQVRSGAIAETTQLPSDAWVGGQEIAADGDYLSGVINAVETRQLNLLGPFDLQHGGAAIIAIQPVVIADQQPYRAGGRDDATISPQQTWGAVSALIDVNDLIAMTGLAALKQQGVGYRLARRDAEDSGVISHPPPPSDIDFKALFPLASANPVNAVAPYTVRTEVEMPGADWYLELAENPSTFSAGALMSFYSLCGLFSVLVGYLSYYLGVGPRKIRSLLEKTASQHYSQQRLMKKEHQKLRELTNAVEQSCNAIMVMNRQGIIEYVNPWFSQITGYREDEAIGNTLTILNTLHTSKVDFKDLWRTIMLGQRWQGELRNRRKDGEVYWSAISVAPVTNDSGEMTNYVAVFEDITRSKQLHSEVEKMAYEDPLTGLGNRRLFNLEFEQALQEIQRHGRWGALMYLDLDRFKEINDQHGHETGDSVLQVVAQRIRSCSRKTDMAVRLGGDEFIIYLKEGRQPDTAERIAAKLIDLLKEPIRVGSIELQISASIGIRLVTPYHPGSDQLLKQADRALYQAKAAGKSGYYVDPSENPDFNRFPLVGVDC